MLPFDWIVGMLVLGALSGIRALGPDRASNLGAWILPRLAPLISANRTGYNNLKAAFPEKSEDEIRAYGRKMTAFGEWCADQGMPISYHHHMAAPIETEEELDLLMKHSGEGLPLLFDAGHMAFAGGDVLRVIDKHHKRISHVHTKDVRLPVIAALDRTKESFLDAVIKGAFTVPGDGSLDFEAIVKRLASHGYEGWFVVEAEQDPAHNPPLDMAKIGHKELLRVMAAAGYQVVR